MSLRVFLILGASAAAVAPARAAENTDAVAAREIVVTGTRNSYSAGLISSATRTPTDPRDVPQAISIVTGAQIEDQGFRSMGDLLRTVPGVTVSLGEGNRDQIVLRGNGSTADFFVDGLRDDVKYYRGL
jgi:catecholate siderophore receptor